jgi:3-hydroxy-D-aspartate aldolase
MSETLQEYVGLPISEIPTPALMIDLDILEANLARMRNACHARGKLYRPHAKAHKSSLIARLQLAHGAQGQCAAKLAEAEMLVGGGIRDILITAPVVGPRKIRRLLALNRITSDIKIVADSATNVQEISAMAAAAGARIKVLIDVNVGQDRTGVNNPQEAVVLAQMIASEPGLTLAGIQAYAGTNQHIVGFEKRRANELLSLERAVAARNAVEKAGYAVGILSVGGTGTYDIDTEIAEVTEIQPGSYIFMDAHYSGIGGPATSRFEDFCQSLSVYTTIISRPVGERAVTDGGNKALSTDEGLPVPVGLTGANYRSGGDEYGIVDLRDANRALAVGDKLEFIPGHCDTTVNLHNFYFAIRKGTVAAIWPIEGRGRMD